MSIDPGMIATAPCTEVWWEEVKKIDGTKRLFDDHCRAICADKRKLTPCLPEDRLSCFQAMVQEVIKVVAENPDAVTMPDIYNACSQLQYVYDEANKTS